MNAVFLDRDGTVTVGAPAIDRVDSPEKVQLLPNTLEALELLATLDYGVFFVTNQTGIAEGKITEADFEIINDRVLELIEPTGIVVLETYFCPHDESSNCRCRKPKPGMLQDAAEKYEINLKDSWMIGDRATDVQTGVAAGTKTILVHTGGPAIAPEATHEAVDLLEAVQVVAKQA